MTASTRLTAAALAALLCSIAQGVVAAPAAGGDGRVNLRCGERKATIEKPLGGAPPRLRTEGRDWALREQPSALGRRYDAVDDARTFVLLGGQRAIVFVAGERWPDCTVEAAAPPPFRARGNEPFWSLETGARRTVFSTPAQRLEGPPAAVEHAPGGRRYAGRLGGRPFAAQVADVLCRDTMTGMPHPARVEMTFGGRTLRGCGGEPADLLRGAEWVVEDIGGAGIVDRSRATLKFDGDGGLAGRSSCNSYTTTYRLGGEGLAVGRAASTMMACADALMDQERRFLDILQQVQRFDITDDGALLLIDGKGRKITARRG
jgi:heat shock protein HslJ